MYLDCVVNVGLKVPKTFSIVLVFRSKEGYLLGSLCKNVSLAIWGAI